MLQKISPTSLTSTQSALYGVHLRRALVGIELGADLPPIHVRKIDGGIYILDGHHRSAAARIYNKRIDAVVCESYEDCMGSPAEHRDIVVSQFIDVGRNADHIQRMTIDSRIHLAYEETQRYLLSLQQEKSGAVRDAMRRASDRLEEWMG